MLVFLSILFIGNALLGCRGNDVSDLVVDDSSRTLLPTEVTLEGNVDSSAVLGVGDIAAITVSNKNMSSFAVTPSGDVFAAPMQGGVHLYSAKGILSNQFMEQENVMGLHYADGFVYVLTFRYGEDFVFGVDSFTYSIMRLNPADGTTDTLFADIPVEEVRSFVVIDDVIYLMSFSPADVEVYAGESDKYRDFDEHIYALHIGEGSLAEVTDVPRPISMYKDKNDKLFIYAFSNDGDYVLYEYNREAGGVREVSVMNDTGYVTAFAYEDDSFIYVSSIGEVNGKRMSDGFVYHVTDVFAMTLCGCFVYFEGDILFLSHGNLEADAEEARLSLRTIRLDAGVAKLLRETDGDVMDKIPVTEDNGTLVISADYYRRVFDEPEMKARTGITTVYTGQPMEWEAYHDFLASIEEGREDVDIYILALNDDLSRNLREQGKYVSLGSSESIRNYLEGCFDWVGEAASTSNGDVWMLPVWYSTGVVWYNPDNFEMFDITPDMVDSFDEYVETIDWLNKKKGIHYSVHATYFTNVTGEWDKQYQMTYGDFANRKFSLDTDVFRHYFGVAWDGWKKNGPDDIYHPILQKDKMWAEKFPEMGDDNDFDSVICKLEDTSVQLPKIQFQNTAWRALPYPRLSNDVDRNYFYTTYAVINPHSKNKELAMAYLEAAAGDMLAAINRPVFVQKDLAAYDGYYPMTNPLCRDLYSIYSDGAAAQNLFLHGWGEIVDKYQRGEQTLDESIAEIQRKVDEWLAECR